MEEASPPPSPAQIFEAQAPAWRSIYAFVETLVVSCAVDLGIPAILCRPAAAPLSLAALAARIHSSPPSDLSPLRRIMRFLTRKHFFSSIPDPSTNEPLYTPTPSSQSLTDLAPLFPLITACFFKGSPGSYLAECVRTGESPFRLANGKDQWTALSEDPGFSSVFNAGMACLAEVDMRAAIEVYEGGFLGVSSVTDVGGGTGAAIGEIVRRFPNVVRGFNFDLLHVVMGAPVYNGVSHVGGDMFEDDIPPAEVILMKWILHCFEDEDCVKLLRKCRRAIPEKTGKLVLLEKIISDEDGLVGDITAAMDIVMLATTGGKERTEEEWKKLFTEAGFHRYNVIKIPATSSIIELYPE